MIQLNNNSKQDFWIQNSIMLLALVSGITATYGLLGGKIGLVSSYVNFLMNL